MGKIIAIIVIIYILYKLFFGGDKKADNSGQKSAPKKDARRPGQGSSPEEQDSAEQGQVLRRRTEPLARPVHRHAP